MNIQVPVVVNRGKLELLTFKGPVILVNDVELVQNLLRGIVWIEK